MSTIPAEIAKALKDARQLAFEANQKTSIRVDEITPYVETKRAYYGEKIKRFYNVPQGNILVFFSNYNTDYFVERITDRVTVSFPRLTEQVDITITV